MLQDTVEWFGDASTNVSVTVTTQSTPQVHWLITRLTLEEAASGARFAAQVGESFVESPHDGPELMGTTGRFLNKSVDLMGCPLPYEAKNWGRVQTSSIRSCIT